MIKKPQEFQVKTFMAIAVATVPLPFIFWLWRFHYGEWGNHTLSSPYLCLFPWDWAKCTAEFDKILTDTRSVRPPRLFLVVLWLLPICAAGSGIWLKYLLARNRIIHSGLTVETMQGLLEEARIELKYSKFPKSSGIHLFNGWKLSLERETRHIMIAGAPGSGKTLIFRRIINEVVKRRDKAIIFDEKGDYTRLVPASLNDGKSFQPIILAPQDNRSAVWDIAADLIVSQDAVELAHRIIPDSGHPFFTQSARAVLAGCTIKLMAEKPKEWTWLDLLNETRQDHATLLRTMLKYHRGADIFLTADYKQVMSTLGQLETHMRVLDMLSTAWPNYDGRMRFSLRDWLVNKTEHRTVIVQHSGRYAELSDGWISALYAVAVTTVTDSNLLDDNDLRRIWFFLDEWGQLPGIKDFERFITLGRSKGVCAVLGLQDDSQIEKNYGTEILSTLTASVGTKILARINAGPTADKLQRYYGDVIFTDYRRDMSADGVSKMLPDAKHEAALNIADLTNLQVTNRGVEVFVSGIGRHLYKVTVPFPQENAKHREPNVPAIWTHTFKVNGTFSNDADIEAFVKATLGKKEPPPRGAFHDPQHDPELPLEEEFNAVKAEQQEANSSAQSGQPETVKPYGKVDLFQDYR